MRTLWLEAGNRIGEGIAIIEAELIEGAGGGRGNETGMVAPGFGSKLRRPEGRRQGRSPGPTVEDNFDLLAFGGPDAEMNAAFGSGFSPNRVAAAHQSFSS